MSALPILPGGASVIVPGGIVPNVLSLFNSVTAGVVDNLRDPGGAQRIEALNRYPAMVRFAETARQAVARYDDAVRRGMRPNVDTAAAATKVRDYLTRWANKKPSLVNQMIAAANRAIDEKKLQQSDVPEWIWYGEERPNEEIAGLGALPVIAALAIIGALLVFGFRLDLWGFVAETPGMTGMVAQLNNTVALFTAQPAPSPGPPPVTPPGPVPLPTPPGPTVYGITPAGSSWLPLAVVGGIALIILARRPRRAA